MPYQMRKHILSLDGDGSAAVTDTGGFPAYGSVQQVRWVPDTQDSGPANIGTLTLFMQHQKEADTGLAEIIWTEGSLVLGNNIHRAPRQPVHLVSGTVIDTGNAGSEPLYAAGADVFKARFTPGDTGLIAGELHIYMGA